MSDYVFSCLPRASGCEWHDLNSSGLIQRLRETHGFEFNRAECLETTIRNRPQPEFLMRSPSGNELVVERKSVVWPDGFLRRHSNFHNLGDRLSSGGRGVVVEVPQAPLERLNLRTVTDLAKKIQGAIDAGCIAHDGGKPIPWRLRPRISTDDLDWPGSDPNGLLLTEVGSSEPEFSPAARCAELRGWARATADAVGKSIPKFESYSNARTILALEFHGEARMASDEDILRLAAIRSAPFRTECQVHERWIAKKVWRDQDSYTVDWKLVPDTITRSRGRGDEH